jgi:hypothetical protein
MTVDLSSTGYQSGTDIRSCIVDSKFPGDLEDGIATGRDRITDAVETLGDAFDRSDVKAHVEATAAGLLHAATTPEGRRKHLTFALGAVVLLLLGVVLRRAGH